MSENVVSVSNRTVSLLYLWIKRTGVCTILMLVFADIVTFWMIASIFLRDFCPTFPTPPPKLPYSHHVTPQYVIPDPFALVRNTSLTPVVDEYPRAVPTISASNASSLHANLSRDYLILSIYAHRMTSRNLASHLLAMDFQSRRPQKDFFDTHTSAFRFSEISRHLCFMHPVPLMRRPSHTQLLS